jgi:hypothetical protein
MAQDLKEYLAGKKCAGFDPVPHYFPTGDYVTYYFRNDRCFEQRLDDIVTVYLAMDTKELVGCKIKGVKHVLRMAGDFGVTLDDGDVRLGLFFFVGAALAKDDAQKDRYEELKRLAKDARVDRKELQLT